MTTKNIFVSAAFAASVSAAFGASIVVDDFDTFPVPGFAIFTPTSGSDGPDTVPGTDTSLLGTVLRTVTATTTGGSGVTAAHNITSKLTFATDSGNTGKVALEYNLGTAADLTAGGGNAFTFVLVSTDLGANVDYTIKVTDSVSGVATTTGDLPVVAGAFNILFSSLSGANLASVTKIEFTLESFINGSDVDVDAFGVNLPPVPEASTYAAVGFMGLAAFGAYRRARK